MDKLNIATSQGQTLLDDNKRKTERVRSKAHNTNIFNEKGIEGFSGNMKSEKVENINSVQKAKVDKLSLKFNKALSEYSIAEKTFNDAANKYINLKNNDSSKSGTTLQSNGATNPKTNVASWKGCYAAPNNWKDSRISSKNNSNASREDIIEQCRVRAADEGYSGFYVSNDNGNYKCFTAPEGSDISKGLIEKMKPTILMPLIIQTPATSDSTDVFALLFTGEIVVGSLINNASDISVMKNMTFSNFTKPIRGCEELISPNISIVSATYGGNCNGLEKKISTEKGVYSVDIGNWKDILSQEMNGKNNGSYTVGSGGPDPAPGCEKSFSASYTCGSTNNKDINMKLPSTGSSALFDCSNEIKKCSSSKLTLSDDGNLVLTDVAGSIVWQTNTKITSLITESKSASKGKYGRNYIMSGEYLRIGEFIGSPSGTCWLTPYVENGLLKVGITYGSINCSGVTDTTKKSTSKGAYGDVGSDMSTAGVYTMSSGNVNKNPRHITFIDETMKKRNLDSIKNKFGNSYEKIKGYNVPVNNLDVFKNTNADRCKSKCTERNDCYGIVMNETFGFCLLKGDDMFPSGVRTKNNMFDTYVRHLNPVLPNSCSTSVKMSYNQDIDNLANGSPMTSNTPCGINKALLNQQKLVNEKKDKLSAITKEVSKSLSQIINDSNILDTTLLKQIKQLEKDTREYNTTLVDTKQLKSTMTTTNAMKSISDLEVSSRSLQYMLWATIAGIGVIAAIKASR